MKIIALFLIFAASVARAGAWTNSVSSGNTTERFDTITQTYTLTTQGQIFSGTITSIFDIVHLVMQAHAYSLSTGATNSMMAATNCTVQITNVTRTVVVATGTVGSAATTNTYGTFTFVTNTTLTVAVSTNSAIVTLPTNSTSRFLTP